MQGRHFEKPTCFAVKPTTSVSCNGRIRMLSLYACKCRAAYFSEAGDYMQRGEVKECVCVLRENGSADTVHLLLSKTQGLSSNRLPWQLWNVGLSCHAGEASILGINKMEFIVSGTQFILILRDSGRHERERERRRERKNVWEQDSLPTSSFMVLVLCPSCCAEINQAGLTRLAHLQLLFDTLSLPCYKVCLAYLSPVSPSWHTAHWILSKDNRKA